MSALDAVGWSNRAGNDAASHPLYRLFYPRSVAVVGASPGGGYGLEVITGLRLIGFEGLIYPVNPNHEMIAGTSRMTTS